MLHTFGGMSLKQPCNKNEHQKKMSKRLFRYHIRFSDWGDGSMDDNF